MAANHRRVSLRVMLSAAALLISAAISAEAVTSPSGQYGIELEVERSEDGATYVCTVLVSDLASSEVLSAPRIQAAAGEEAKTTTAFEVEGVRYELALTVKLEGETFSYRFEAIHDGEVAAVQSGTLALPKASG